MKNNFILGFNLDTLPSYKFIIYCIKSKIDNKTYIGSSKNLKPRIQAHLRELRNKIHHSRYLQNAWNKYGESNFNLSILDKRWKGDQFQVEQIYLDFIQPEYNLNKVCNRPPVSKGKYFSIFNILGEKIEGFHLKNFCKENNLDYTSMSAVNSGTKKRYKNFVSTLDYAEQIKKYRKISPQFVEPVNLVNLEGLIFTVYNQTKFAEEHNLEVRNLNAVINEKRLHTKGFRLLKNKNWTPKSNIRLNRKDREVIYRYLSFTKYKFLKQKDKKKIREKISKKFGLKEGSIYDYIRVSSDG